MIMLVLAILSAFFITNAQATEIEGVKYYTENDKTRIVIQLDQDAKYQIKYDKNLNLSISLIESKIAALDKTYEVNDGLVNTIELKEAKDNVIIINISFNKPAAFEVFSLESPSRIVIDASAFEDIITPEVVSITGLEPSNLALQIDKEINQEETNTTPKKPWYAKSDYGLLSAFFDMSILMIVIYMEIRINSASKFNMLMARKRKTIKSDSALVNVAKELEDKR
jgi:hypothetical protein